VLCAIFLIIVAYLVPHDIEDLRQAMRQRAEMERRAAYKIGLITPEQEETTVQG